MRVWHRVKQWIEPSQTSWVGTKVLWPERALCLHYQQTPQTSLAGKLCFCRMRIGRARDDGKDTVMQIDDAGTPQQHGQVKPRRNLEKYAGSALGVAMVLTSFLLVPLILSQTIGLGNTSAYFFLMALPGLFLGDRWGVHIIGLGMLISGWVNRTKLIYAVVGAIVIRGSGASPRVSWDSRKAKYSGTYAAIYEDGPTGSGMLRISRYTYLFAILILVGMALALMALSANGLPDWLVRFTTVILAVMLLKIVASYWYAQMLIGPKDQASLERLRVIHHLASGAAQGMRPRDYDIADLETLTSIPDGSTYELTGWLSMAERCLDIGDMDGAEQAITRATLIANPFHGNVASIAYRQAAFLAAHRDNDADAARIWLKQASSPAFEAYTDARVEAAILMAEGKLQEAHDTVLIGLASLDTTLEPGAAAFEEDLLGSILARIETAIAPDRAAS